MNDKKKIFILAIINAVIAIFYFGVALYFTAKNNTSFMYVSLLVSGGHFWIVSTLNELDLR